MKKIDLTGKSFGDLVVIEEINDRCKKSVMWKCRCKCGNIINVSSGNLLSGNSKSCGCRNRTKDLTNMRFGKLVALYRTTEIGSRRPMWMCKCDCGNLCEVGRYDLESGGTRSCGCLARDHARKLNFKHGLSNSRLYSIWRHMKQRCYDVSNVKYKNYGARGIKICDEWNSEVDGYVNFYNWAMSHGYKEDLTIERIDVNDDYCPENCEWIPLKYQAFNKVSTPRTIDGYSIPKICYDRDLDYKKMLLCLNKFVDRKATKNELLAMYLNTFPPIKTK